MIEIEKITLDGEEVELKEYAKREDLGLLNVEPPDYWKEFIDGKEEIIKEKLDEGGVDAFPILWGADIHGSKGSSNSNGAGTSVTKNIGLVAKYTLDKYKAPYALFSGDIHSQASHVSEDRVEAEYEAVNAILFVIDKDKLLVEKGNHDGAWGEPVDGVYYLKNIGGKKIYNRLFRRQSLDRNRVFGGDGSYFYVDSPQNVRIIMLNGHTDGDGSVDADGNAVYNSMKNGVYGTEQLKWLCEVALNVPEGTRIIVSAHQPFGSSKDGELLAGILEAYNKRITYTGTKNVQGDYWGKDVTDTTYTNISVSADFSEAKGKIVIYLHGHIHKDTIDATSYSFAVASITTAGADVRDTDPPLRTPNTATETALDFVIMSKTAINFIRIGAGSDRVIALDDTVYYSIKNNLTNVKSSNSAGNIVEGNSYSATISANTGYELESVVITMGGVDITSSVYLDGVITITEVTGNIVITASATKIEEDEPTDPIELYTGNASDYQINKKYSGTSIVDGNGYYLTDVLDVDFATRPYLHIKGVTTGSSASLPKLYKIGFYKNGTISTVEYMNNIIDVSTTSGFVVDMSAYSQYDGIQLLIQVSSSAMTESDILTTSQCSVISSASEEMEDSTPSYTNLAKTLTEGYRLSSSGGLSAESGATTCEDYLELAVGDIFYIKGFGALDDYNVAIYNSSKSVLDSSKPSVWTDTARSYEYDDASGIATITFNTVTTQKYMRVSGILTGTTKDVIITKNEPITDDSTSNGMKNVFVPANATLNKRISSSGESTSNGMYITEYLEFDASTASSPIIWLPEGIDLTITNQRVEYLDADKTKIGSPYIKLGSTSTDYLYVAEENGRYYVDISKFASGGAVSYYENTKYIRIGLSSGVTTAITVDDIADVEILFEKDK